MSEGGLEGSEGKPVGSEGQLEGSRGQPAGSEGQPEGERMDGPIDGCINRIYPHPTRL